MKFYRFLILVSLFSFIVAAPACAEKKTGTALLKSTQEGSSVSGKVLFEETSSGLKVSVDIQKAVPGKHGFHIHENGDCGDAGQKAGSHYNPEGAPHGILMKDGFSHAHAGDLGNVEVATDGTARMEALLPGLTLSGGQYNVAGRSVILHEKADDFGQPVGNAGGRVACGVIEEG